MGVSGHRGRVLIMYYRCKAAACLEAQTISPTLHMFSIFLITSLEIVGTSLISDSVKPFCHNDYVFQINIDQNSNPSFQHFFLQSAHYVCSDSFTLTYAIQVFTSSFPLKIGTNKFFYHLLPFLFYPTHISKVTSSHRFLLFHLQMSGSHILQKVQLPFLLLLTLLLLKFLPVQSFQLAPPPH